MLKPASVRTLILIWAAWVVILLGFQTLVDTRMQPQRPDYAVIWSSTETARTSQNDEPYLIEPFMNRQVSMDSEYYLSIAVAGYDDPLAQRVSTRGGRVATLNYAFFPLYPTLMGAVMLPLEAFGLPPIHAATLAGVIVSVLGTLGAMIALYDLTRDQLGDGGGIRTAFYFLIFPSAFFLGQVFTEGLFTGLAFGCLALARRRHLLAAGILAMLATWTRSVGVALVIPLAFGWLSTLDWRLIRGVLSRQTAFPNLTRAQVLRLVFRYGVMTLAVLLPIIAYTLWNLQFGRNFQLVQDRWFGRGLFDFERMLDGWEYAFEQIVSGEFLASRAYYLLETASVIIVVIASLFMVWKYPGLTLFGLAGMAAGITTGAPQSLIRYAMAVPAIFIFLSHLGKREAFDRAWTLASILVLAMQTALFTYDMWVA